MNLVNKKMIFVAGTPEMWENGFDDDAKSIAFELDGKLIERICPGFTSGHFDVKIDGIVFEDISGYHVQIQDCG